MITIELASIPRESFKCAYTGREQGCRCGCHGNYFEPGTRGFTRALNKAYKLNPRVAIADNPDEYNVACTDSIVEVDENNALFSAHGFMGGEAGNTLQWVDIVLPGCPLKTITLYTTRN